MSRLVVVPVGVFLLTLALAGTHGGDHRAGLALPSALAVPGTIVIVGEIHGTNEVPEWVAEVASELLEGGLAVTLALEIEREEAERIGEFVDSSGADADRAALLAGPFWSSGYQDGRRSAAQMELLDRVRRFRAAGHRIEVALLDSAAVRGTRERPEHMARSLLATPADRVVLAVVGNVHSRNRRGVPWNAEYEPMAFLAAKSSPERRIVSLNLSHEGGRVWSCASSEPSSCGERAVPGASAPLSRGVVRLVPTADGHDGEYGAGTLTPSRPAIERSSTTGRSTAGPP